MTKAKSEPTLEKPDIFIPLVIGDYLADTMHLSTEQHGAYLLLLMHYWRSQGPIAASDEACASVVKLTLKEWRKMKPIVLAFFRPGPTDGTLVQKRAQEEIERATSNKAEASNRGKAGAKARWEDKPGMRSHASGMQNGGVSGCKPDANGMLGDGTLSSSSTPTENLQSEGSQCAREAFRRFAAVYPKRAGDPVAATEEFFVDLVATGKAPPIEALISAAGRYGSYLKKNPTEPIVFMRRFITERWGAWIEEEPKTAVPVVHTPDWGDASGDAVASLKHEISPLDWLYHFAGCRWDGAKNTLEVPNLFLRDRILQRFEPQLERLAQRLDPQEIHVKHVPLRRVA